MRLTVLASSSSGNSAVVEVAGLRILIDAGMSFKKLEALMAEAGFAPESIDAVLVTHEHSDHITGVSGFAALGKPIYATRGTSCAGESVIKKKIAWNIIPSECVFKLGEVLITAFSIPHDAAEPVGFSIEGEGERLTWALDMGHLTAPVKKLLRASHIIMLESNYCPDLLEADTRRPFALKARIKGRHGHLSNDDAFTFLTSERSELWREVYLGHLSRECNDRAKVQRRYEGLGLPVVVVDPVNALQGVLV